MRMFSGFSGAKISINSELERCVGLAQRLQSQPVAQQGRHKTRLAAELALRLQRLAHHPQTWPVFLQYAHWRNTRGKHTPRKNSPELNSAINELMPILAERGGDKMRPRAFHRWLTRLNNTDKAALAMAVMGSNNPLKHAALKNLAAYLPPSLDFWQSLLATFDKKPSSLALHIQMHSVALASQQRKLPHKNAQRSQEQLRAEIKRLEWLLLHQAPLNDAQSKLRNALYAHMPTAPMLAQQWHEQLGAEFEKRMADMADFIVECGQNWPSYNDQQKQYRLHFILAELAETAKVPAPELRLSMFKGVNSGLWGNFIGQVVHSPAHPRGVLRATITLNCGNDYFWQSFAHVSRILSHEFGHYLEYLLECTNKELSRTHGPALERHVGEQWPRQDQTPEQKLLARLFFLNGQYVTGGDYIPASVDAQTYPLQPKERHAVALEKRLGGIIAAHLPPALQPA